MGAAETPYDDAPPHEGEEEGRGSVDAFATRQLPRNVAAEAGLLGAVFIDNRCLEACEDQGLSPDDFYLPAHRMIYAACLQLWRGGSIADPTTLRPHFEDADELKEIGGAAYLGNLMANAVSTFNAKEYARIIRDCSIKRDLIAAGEELVSAGYDADLDRPAITVLEQHEAGIWPIAERLDDSAVRGSDRDAQYRNLTLWIEQGVQGVRTGLVDLDRRFKIVPGNLIILAARPSMGKSVMGQKLSDGPAKLWMQSDGALGGPALVFSLEMSAEEWNIRRASEEAGVPYQRILDREFQNDDERRKVLAARDAIFARPVVVDEAAGLSVAQIHRRAQRMKRKQGLGVVVIDQLGHIQIDREHRAKSTNDGLGSVTRGLKRMAKELNVPVILLHQLSREVERRENKRPILSDLRDSGNIEQDADAVMFLYREAYYLERNEPSQRENEDDDVFAARHARWKRDCEAKKHDLEIIVPKWRMGRPGTIKAHFDGPYARIGDRVQGDIEDF